MFVFQARRIPPWKLALAAAGVILAAGLALFISGVLLLVLAPVALGAFVLRSIWGSKRNVRRDPSPVVIEGRYEVVERR